jgi:hypothetical protein
LPGILVAKIAGDESPLHDSKKMPTAGHNAAPQIPPRFPTTNSAVLFESARERWGTMREEFASNSFLAMAVAGLVLLCSGLIALAMI